VTAPVRGPAAEHVTLRGVRALLAVLSVGYAVELLVLIALRIGHPYVLEWEEGAMVDQSLRILRGLPLYVAPSMDFVPQLYAPLYFQLGAWASALLGEGFVPLRVVSVLASLGAMGFMAALARREARSWLAALLTVGFFAATYRLGVAWLDVARVDALFLFFTMAAVHVVRTRETRAGEWVAGVLFWLAFLTKQQGLLFALPMLGYVALARGVGPALRTFGPFAVLASASTLWLHWTTDGWSTWYVFVMPSGHEIFLPMVVGFWWMDLIQPIGIACVFVLVWLGLSFPRSTPRTRGAWNDFLFWFCFLGGCVGISWGSRMHWGGATNVVLPAYMAIAVVFGVSLARWLRGPGWRPVAIGGLAVLQLGWLFYDPRPLVPGERERRAGDQLVERMAAIDGEVLATWHGYIPERAGKRVYAHRSAINDVMRAGDSEARRLLEADLIRSLDERRFAVVVVDQPYFTRPYMRVPLERSYRIAGPMLEEGLEVGGLVGYRANPYRYLPLAPAGDAAPGSAPSPEEPTVRR